MTLDLSTLSALRARRDDLDAFRVLADRLQSDGDPRGELISLQLAGQPKLVERHLAMHARTLLGRLFTHQSSLTLEWGAGFIRMATVTSNEGREQRRWDGRLLIENKVRKPFAWLTAELLALESAALLEELTLSLATSSRTQALFAAALEQVAVQAPPTLRRLRLRTPVPSERREWPWDAPQEELDAACWGLPHRREVPLHGRLITVEADQVSLLEQAHAVLRDGG